MQFDIWIDRGTAYALRHKQQWVCIEVKTQAEALRELKKLLAQRDWILITIARSEKPE